MFFQRGVLDIPWEWVCPYRDKGYKKELGHFFETLMALSCIKLGLLNT